MRGTTLSTLQALACFVIAVAGLVPIFPETRPFWGFTYVVPDYAVPTVFEVEPESPAAFAGLQVDDEFVTANGSPVDDRSVIRTLNTLQPGETVSFDMSRQGKALKMTATAEKPSLAAIYYPTVWHPGVGVLAGLLGLIILAARPPRSAPRWLPGCIFASGIGLAILFYLAIASDNFLSFLIVRQYHMMPSWAPRQFAQSWVGLTASLTLVASSIWHFATRRLNSVGVGETSQSPADSIA